MSLRIHNTGPSCPNCGCQDVRILRHPQRAGWLSAHGQGRAQCNACSRPFAIAAIQEGQDVEHAEPLVTQRTPTPPSVQYQVLLCPACGSEKVRVTSTQRPVRHHKCKECDHTFKTVEKKERPAL